MSAAALESIWCAALTAADPYAATLAALPDPPIRGRLLVLAAGKAAARMALAAEARYGDQASGLAVAPDGYGAPLQHLEMTEASHPTPDARGLAAAAKALTLAEGLREGDLLLALISGGASALLPAPVAGVSLAEKQALTKALLASGAPIAAINGVRKHLSRLKGGRLALAAWPARTLTLAVSDVPDDDAAVIGSGPTVGDPTSLADARDSLSRYGVEAPDSVLAALRDPANETPKPGDPRLARSAFQLILRPADMLAAAGRAAEALGYRPMMMGDALRGEARLIAADHAQLALSARPGTALISGGELDVTGASGSEPGGRCREYLLALALALNGAPGISACALDTDGIDGRGGEAGARIDPTTLTRAAVLNLDSKKLLAHHASGAFFTALGDAIVTGPTRTNLADLRVILIEPH
jgi:glycerate 2-kinase